MKNVYPFVILISFLIIALSGCAGNPAEDHSFTEVRPGESGLLFKEHPADEPLFLSVPPQPSLGFMSEYYLFIPPGLRNADSETRLLVEPNNTGTVSDSHSRHAQSAQRFIRGGHIRSIAVRLNTPLLVPAFDRPETGWERYTHALDRDTMMISQGPLQRIDLQLIAMIEHAKVLLRSSGIHVKDRVFLNGFSASGNFVNRFVALHPDQVRAAACGGINGMPILPLTEINGHLLIFHVGIGDIQDFTGMPFDIESFGKVAQYLYMGELDDNDTLPYDDAYNEDERALTKMILGESMSERWQKSQSIIRSMDLPIQFTSYKGVGHQITPSIIEDLVQFFEANMGETAESMR